MGIGRWEKERAGKRHTEGHGDCHAEVHEVGEVAFSGED